MAQIKSYTGIEQSKELAEILPIESADMRIGNYVGESGKVDGTNVHYYPKGESFAAPEIIYAWSLAALLRVLPSASLDSSDDHHYRLYCMKKFTEWHDNAIDACVEMIVWLKENRKL